MTVLRLGSVNPTVQVTYPLGINKSSFVLGDTVTITGTTLQLYLIHPNWTVVITIQV